MRHGAIARLRVEGGEAFTRLERGGHFIVKSIAIDWHVVKGFVVPIKTVGVPANWTAFGALVPPLQSVIP